MTTDTRLASGLRVKVLDPKGPVRHMIGEFVQKRLDFGRASSQAVEAQMSLCQVHFGSYKAVRPVRIYGIGTSEHCDFSSVVGSTDFQNHSLRLGLQELLGQSPLTRKGISLRSAFLAYCRAIPG